MSRKAINTALACLLCLLPVLSFAQSLQRIEYWFDDDFSSRSTISVSGSEDAVTKAISTDGMDNGVHKFSFRIRRTDGKYSAISSSLFFKQNDSVGEKLEYWLDNDYEHRVSMNTSATEAEQELTFDLHDMEQCPIGFHQLHIRVTAEGKGMSSVYTTGIWKCPLGNATQIEYWFDNDMENSQVLSGHLSSDGKGYIITADLDVSQLSIGMHRLNYRPCDKENQFYGAVQSAPILKVPSGKASILEYWLDDNLSTRKQFSGSTTTGGYMFTKDLDLGNVSPGHHRLSVRGKSSDGKLVTAVTSMPIIVKSRYGNGSEPVDAKMKSFTIAVDNEEPVTVNVNRDDELILNPYALNVRDLNTGNHTLKAHFWNTANAGVALEQNFTVNAVETPTITLTAQEEEGRVTLKFNSIPNDVKWGLVRTDANGVNVKIDGKTESCYPSEITSVDTPPAGSYKYKARGYYMDVDGTRKAVNSNEVEVAVVASQNGPFGSISGSIRNANGGTIFAESWTVTFSDGVTMGTDFAGSYFRDKIPVGTVLEITAQSRNFSCKPVTVTVKEGTNMVFNEATLDEGLVRSRYSSDLEFDSYVEFEPRLHMKFKVRNRTRLPWHGRLCIVTGRKDFMDNPPKNPFEQTDWSPETQVLAGSVAPYTVTDNIQYDYSDKIYLSPDESKEVFISHHIPLTSPPSNKDELYYFFVQSVDEYGTKLVAVNEDYNIKENPLVQLVNNGQYDSDRQFEEDIESCIALVMALCSTVKEFDGKLGDMSRCMDEMQQTLGYTLDYYDLAERIERSNDFSDLHHNIPEWEFYNILYYEDRRFLGMVNSVRDNIAKEVRACKNTLKYLKDVKKCIDMVKGYNQWQDMNELERTGAIAEKILDLAEKKVPFASILKMYLDVTKTTIHNINGLAEKWYANHDYDTFYNNSPELYGGSKFEFDIKVKKKLISTFDAEDIKERIFSVEINCVGHVTGNDPLKCTATYTPEVVDGKLRLRRINKTGDAPSVGGVIPIEDMWMTIWWSNGRISHVPIRNSEEMQGNGVKHDKNHYTITFQSGTRETEHMADIIFLDD